MSNSKGEIVCLDRSRIACNIPEKNEIYIDRYKWNDGIGKPSLQISLVIHEFFGLMNLDKGYELSSKVMDLYIESPTPIFKWICLGIVKFENSPGSFYHFKISEEGMSTLENSCQLQK